MPTPVLVFPETRDWYPSIIYVSRGTMYLVHLLPDGPSEGGRVDDLTQVMVDRITSQIDPAKHDPYDAILSAQAQVCLSRTG